MTTKTIAINDIKYDLLKIIEPWDGILSERQYQPVYNLFISYLLDLKKEDYIKDFTVVYTIRDTTISYDVSVKLSNERSPKKLKIHVGSYKHPWIVKKIKTTKGR